MNALVTPPTVRSVPSLKIRTAEKKLWSGIRWSAAAQIATMFVRLGSTLILTRLLLPEAYGLFGTMMVVMTTVELLSDIGMLPALLRHPQGDQPRWLLVGWWIGFFRSAGIAAVLVMAAYPMSMFYGRPELFGLMAVVSLRPFLLGMRSPAMVLFRRKMDYRALFIDEFTQTVVGVGVSVLLAWKIQSVGAWALVVGTIAGALSGLVVSYILAPFRVRWLWDWTVAHELGGFGRMVFLNTLVMAFWLGLDRFVGPWFVSFEAMGFYIVAMNLAAVAEGLLTRATDVYFSSILQSPNEAERALRHQNYVNKLCRIGMPLGCLAALSAPLAVAILYKPNFAECGLILAVLLARLLPRALGQLDFQMLLVRGTLRPSISAYLLGGVVHGAMIPLMMHWLGTVGLAMSCLLSTVVVTFVQNHYSGLDDGKGSRRLMLSVLWGAWGIAGAAGLAVLLIR